MHSFLIAGPRSSQSPGRNRWRKLALGVHLLAACSISSHALEPTTPLTRLNRQSWTMENGLPQNTVAVLLQSRSGFLWAGTELGLARFDGVSFRTFDHATSAFPDAEVRCLLDAPDGTLWVGTSDGLVRWKDGRSFILTTVDGLPSNNIRGLVTTVDGTIWAWTEQGLASLSRQSADGRFVASAVSGSLSATITSVAVDSAGNLWAGTTQATQVFHGGSWQTVHAGASLVVAASGDILVSTPDGVFLEQKGRSTLAITRSALPLDGISFLARLADGAIAAASKSTVLLTTPGSGHAVTRFTTAKQLPGSRIESIYADREGCLWIGTNRGLARVFANAVQLLPTTDLLAANAVVSFLEDAEGDLWIGTETAGLHILRDARFRIIGQSDGLTSDATTAIVQDAKGVVWIGTRDGGLNRINTLDPSVQATSLTTASGLLSNVILALAAAPDGSLWIGTPDGLNHVQQNKITSYTSADGLPDDFIRSLLAEPDNSVWIGTRRGLTHLDPANPGRMRSFTHTDGLGSDLIGALARASNGDLWIATLNGLSRLRQGTLHNYTKADGLSSNVITALDITPDGTLWIGTQDAGLNFWNGQHMTDVQSPGLPTAIHAILHDDVEQEFGGHLWLASNSGLATVSVSQLKQCATCRLPILHFTTADGLRSRETSSNSHPTALRTRDGMLWFATPRGIVVANPAHFPDAPAEPPVAVERFAVDDEEIAPSQNPATPKVAAGHLRFQFDYAGLSFASPQKLRYQYMLEGFDHAWTNAGTRRTAYYTNIPPGHYRFRVRAAFADSSFPAGPAPSGVNDSSPVTAVGTSGSEADFSFELLPHFYQTAWFYLVLILLSAVLLFLFIRILYRRRVLRVEREFRAVMAERNRIAREIHDTLAQGYVGISLQLEILGELLRHNRTEAAARHLTLTQGYVREGLDDARQSIWALRSQDSGEQTLPIRLSRMVEKADQPGLSASLEVHGAYRAIAPEAEKELLRIAQEAIQNASKHAEASQLSVRLEYDEHMVALTVTDNGRGFLVSEALPVGHYGLTGMKERIALIHGQIEIASHPGQGTTIRVQAPAQPAMNSHHQTESSAIHKN